MVKLHGAVLPKLDNFPSNPKEGRLAFVDDALYIYTDIDGSFSWYPITNRTKRYIHSQPSSSVSWTVTHDLNSTQLIVICYDDSDNLIIPTNITYTTSDSIVLTFASAQSGRCAIFIDIVEQLTLKGEAITISHHEETVSNETDTINLPFTVDEDNVSVHIDGAKQYPSAYSLDGDQKIILSEDVPAGTEVLVSNLDTDAAAQVAYATQAGFARGQKNELINGRFEICQYGTSQTSSGYGSDDCWANFNQGSTKVHSIQSFNPGQTDVPWNPKYYSRTIVTSVSGADNFVMKQQRIENVFTYSGQKCVLSFWARADSNKTIVTEPFQFFGTGGSPSSTVLITSKAHSLTPTWQKFIHIIDVPSISGKILGTNNNDYLGIIFWFDAGSNFNSRTSSLGQQSGTFDLSDVQLEPGEVATDIAYRPIGLELMLCQRFFEKSFAQGITPANNVQDGRILQPAVAHSASSSLVTTNFKVEKRIAPTITYYRPSVQNGADNKWSYYSGGWTASTSTSVNNISTVAFRTYVNGSWSVGDTHLIAGHWTAKAEL